MPPPRLRLRSPDRLRWPRRTARVRLTVLYGGLFLISGVVLVASTYVFFERATAYTPPQLPKIPQTPAIQLLPKLPGSLGQDLNLLQQARQQLSQAPTPEAVGVPPMLGHVEQQLTRAQHQLHQAQRQLEQAVHQVARAGSVQAAQRAADSHELLVDSGIALAIVVLLALLAGWSLSGRMLRPIRTIIHTARRISSTNLHERLALDGPQDELKELGDTLDGLFGRLDAAFEAQRHFIANASHELRTPLTVERNLLQVALDDPHTSVETWRSTAQELLAYNDEQKHLIEALLALAISESGLDHHERVDLGEICRTALSRRPGNGTDFLDIRVDTEIRSAPLEGDPRLIERLVANLVDNAVGHNVVGGRVQISTAVAEGQAVLSVTNSGLRVAPNDIDRLFQPFQRLDPRRTHHKDGLGLGLSIVRAIATTHHATIDAHPKPDGGLVVTVTFPAPTSSRTGPERTSRGRSLAGSRA